MFLLLHAFFCCCWCCRCCRKESITRRNRAGGENYHKCRRGRSLIIRPNNSHTRPLHARIYEYIYMYICIKIFRGDDGQKHDTFQNQNIFSSAERNRKKRGMTFSENLIHGLRDRKKRIVIMAPPKHTINKWRPRLTGYKIK